MAAFSYSGHRIALSSIAILAWGLVPTLAWPQAPRQQTVVVLWNQAVLAAIRNARTSPPVAARAMAIVHTCMFDAWAAYDEVAVGTRLGGSLRRPQSERTAANKEKAISFAAYRALDDLFPGQRATNMDPLMQLLGFNPEEAEDASTPSGIGHNACQAVLDFRHRDGANQLGDRHPGAYSDYTGFTPANTAEVLIDPNRWQPLLVNGTSQKWLLPHWAMVRPFGLTSGAQLRDVVLAQGPARYPSAGYWKQALDMVDLSAHLGDTEKVIAEYWADGASTVTPPGHWMVFAQHVSQR